MATLTIVWIGIALLVVAIQGLLIGYMVGHGDGYRQGYEIGKLHD